MKKGIFCISIDTELLWGRKDLDYSKFIGKTKKERGIIKKLLQLFRKYKIPATWAIVGKLYEKGDELWSGVDFINWIKKENIHEIASHSYSHEDFTKISREKAIEEFRRSKAKSFIFPRNKIKYLDLLKEYNFKTYRGKDRRSWELLFPGTPPVYNPKINGGLVNIKGSFYFPSARGIKRFIPNGLRFIKCKMGIDKAIKEKKVFHLWFHPVDFADNTNSLLVEFKKILEYANKKRKEGFLEIKNMNQIFEDI